MGQYTSRLNTTNNQPTTQSLPQQPNHSSTSNPVTLSSVTPSHSAPSSQHLSSNSSINNLRRRRSSTNYTSSHLPNPRRRRLPSRISESLRFWNRRNQHEHVADDESDSHSLDRELDAMYETLRNDPPNFGNNINNSLPSIPSSSNVNDSAESTPLTSPQLLSLPTLANSLTRDPLDGLNELVIASSRQPEQFDRQYGSTSSLNNNSSPLSSSTGTSPSSTRRQRSGNNVSNNTNTNNDAVSFEHQTEMLSRLLEIAATSTVMNLLGTAQVNGRRFDNTSRLPSLNASPSTNDINNGDDSNFQEFVNALRNGLLTNELTSRYNDINGSNTDRDTMTFFRAFRFDGEILSTNYNELETRDHDDLSEGPFNFGLDRNDTRDEDLSNGPFDFGLHSHHNDNSSTNGANNNNNNNVNNNTESQNVPVMIIGVRSVQQNSSDPLGSLSTSSTTNNTNGGTSTTSTTSTRGNPTPNNTNDPSPSNTPNNEPQLTQQQVQQRSWVIFVMGNTFAWNHPLLSAPSLMSENPTYDDLLNLQELIGQVKPQVATKEELYKHSDQLYEVKLKNSSIPSKTDYKSLKVDQFERCQICLSDYEDSEIVRKLSSCNHFYHRSCVDNWLLNGKNNCPLCRSKGIVNGCEDEEEHTGVSA